MQGKDNTKSTLYQLFGQLSDKEIFGLLHKQPGIERYVKKLITEKLLFLIVLAQRKQHKGPKEISISLNDDAISRAIGAYPVRSKTDGLSVLQFADHF